MYCTGALQAYRKALELKRAAALQDRDSRRRRLQRACHVRASRLEAAHAAENGDAAAPSHLEVPSPLSPALLLLHQHTRSFHPRLGTLRQLGDKGQCTSAWSRHSLAKKMKIKMKYNGFKSRTKGCAHQSMTCPMSMLFTGVIAAGRCRAGAGRQAGAHSRPAAEQCGRAAHARRGAPCSSGPD